MTKRILSPAVELCQDCGSQLDGYSGTCRSCPACPDCGAQAFSAATIQALSVLSVEIASIFQKLCNVSISWKLGNSEHTTVITSPFGNASDNALTEAGLSYNALAKLLEAGLILEINGWWEAPAGVFANPFDLGGTAHHCITLTGFQAEAKKRLSVIHFTTAGKELHSIVHRTPNALYSDRFFDWAEGALHIQRPVQPG